MNSETKIALSGEELKLVNDTGFILTKRAIIEKVYLLFGQLAQSYVAVVQNNKEKLPQPLLAISPKIAKGENYLQLPYVVLDYPRLYEKENILAVRTMFWWGNFFSITLHLGGSYKTALQQQLADNIAVLQAHDFYICINKDQWQHHFEADNYIAVKDKSAAAIQQIILQQHFIKVSVKFSLQQWNEMPAMLKELFSIIITLVKY